MKHKNISLSQEILFKSVLIALLLTISFTSWCQIITTFAGIGKEASYYGDGGPASAAELHLPYAVSTDAAGNVYIADYSNFRIREVNTSGIINTVAGTGTSGYSGDGGPATAADIATPFSVASDASGNLYIADDGHQRVRKVNTSGIISTIAGTGSAGFSGDGGPATAADLDAPIGASVDAYGNIYIADYTNARIRKINTSGIISTIAGNGKAGYSGMGGQATAAELDQPFYAMADNSGNVYISDRFYQRVLKVNTSGVIKPFAGNDGASNVTIGDGLPATAAAINVPYDLAIDASGNVYIACEGESRIRVVNTSGIINTYAGDLSSGGYSGDGGPATDAELLQVTGVTVDAVGNVYIADYGNDVIRKVSYTFTALTTPVNITCNGASTGSITAIPYDGMGPYTYSWSPGGQTTSTAVGLSAGTYTLTLTENGGATATASVTLTQPNVLTVTTTYLSPSCNLGSDGTASAIPSNGTSPYTYSWSPSGQTMATASGLSAGTYMTTVYDNCGAAATASVTIIQKPSLRDSIIQASLTNISTCNGTGSAMVGAAGGNSPYTYLWSGGGATNTFVYSSVIKTFSYTGAVQNWTVPAGVTNVIISTAGAQGGADDTPIPGGPGAAFTGVYKVTPGHVISVVVGGMGGATTGVGENGGGGGGGGASWVYDSSLTGTHTGTPSVSALLAVAAGGGGEGYSDEPAGAGGTDLVGNSTTNGTAYELSNPSGSSPGGTGGNGGTGGDSPTGTSVYAGAGGAGWFSSGQTYSSSPVALGGNDWASGFASVAGYDNASGGFGGGGGGGEDGSGGGGGYNGGGGGFYNVGGGSGGGGGSYLNGTLLSSAIANQKGNGSVTIYQGVPVGTYSVTVTDNCGALATASVTITQPVALTTGATILSNACNGTSNGNAEAIPSGGIGPYTYSWSNGITSNPTGSALSAGTYTVTVTDNCSNIVSTSVTITQPNTHLTATTITVNNVSCWEGSNGQAKVSTGGGTPPYVYFWSPNNSSTYIASGLSAGTYSVTVLDNNGCNASSSTTITQPTALKDSVSTIAYPHCGGETASATIGVSGGTSPYSYQWNPNISTTATATGLNVRGYAVQVKDNNGCYSNLSFSITQPPVPVLEDSIVRSATINVMCNAGTNGSATVGVKYGTTPYTYSWSGGGTNATVTGLSVGTYTVTVNDAGGCMATASVSIGQPGTVSATAFTGGNISCNGGSNGQAKVSVSGGATPYIYSWSPVGGSAYIASGLSAGTYTVTVSDQCGASVSSSATVTQPALLKDSVTISYPLCTGATGSATMGVTGGTSPYKYTWSPNISSTATATGLSVRAYAVQVKDNNGCYASFNFSISQPAALRDSIVRSATVNISCSGTNNGSATAGVKYGTAPYTYSWSPAGGNSAIATGLSAGTYTVTVNDGEGCTVTASVSITQPGALTSTAFIGTSISCNGNSNGTAKVSVSGGSSPYTYSWWSPVSSSTYIASGLPAGTYSVTVEDNCGTSASSSVAVTQPAILSDSVISSSVVSPPCSGGGTGSVTIGVTGGTSPYNYKWSPNVSTTATATGLTVRTYVVQVKDAKGCYNNVTLNVTCSTPETATYKGTGASCCPSSDNINLYPNPNTGQFTLSGLQQGMILEMYDYTGKMISRMTTTNESMQLNILNQANGVYLIRVLDKDGNLVSEKKVVKTQ